MEAVNYRTFASPSFEVASHVKTAISASVIIIIFIIIIIIYAYTQHTHTRPQTQKYASKRMYTTKYIGTFKHAQNEHH